MATTLSQQTTSFHSGHHRHPNNNDDEWVLYKQVENSLILKEALARDATIMHNSDPSDDDSEETDSTLATVKVSSTQEALLSAPLNYSLISKVLGQKFKLDHFSAHLRRLWKPMGTLGVIYLGSDFFKLDLSEKSDYERVLEGVPWLISGHYITLARWVPNFNPSEATITHAAVWVRLPGLPIEYYDKEIFSQIGSTIGNRLIKLDRVTERVEKAIFARLCIEVDLNRPLFFKCKLGKLVQQIKNENLDHNVCFQCRRIGHLKKDCIQNPSDITNPAHHQASSHMNSVPSTSHETPNTIQNLTSSKSSPSVYGPSLQVPPSGCQSVCQTEKDPGQWQFQVPNSKVAIGIEQKPLGSRFQVLEQENLLDLTDEP